MFAQHDNMTLSIEELKTIVKNLRKDGLNSQQIADELSLSQDTIQWLLPTQPQNDQQTYVLDGGPSVFDLLALLPLARLWQMLSSKRLKP